jgi:formylglycine-generating enzyme required for sulfatase activity
MIEYLEFFNFVSSQKWIPALLRKLRKIHKEREKELAEINNITFCDPIELAKYYVEPDCQDVNPANRRVEDEMVSKEAVMMKIIGFFQQPTVPPAIKQLFVLSDAGMGKSALLAMIKLMHLTKFWPWRRDCVLTKLGPDTLEEIGKIDNPHETILLLDSLDEDPKAYDRDEDPKANDRNRVKVRLIEILDASKPFAKVIITCRTQFLPKTGKDPLERPNVISIGGYSCFAKYLSFFDNQKVYQYLSKRFPGRFLGIGTDQKKIAEAKKIIATMGSLRCRPMLLSYIEDLMESPLLDKKSNEYTIYNALVYSWLNRELLVRPQIIIEDLYDACIILAVWMQIRQKREISEGELDKQIGEMALIKRIKGIEIKGRSLLNRNSDGDYRFSHFSIQEFLVAKYISERPSYEIEGKIFVTAPTVKMIGESGKQYPNIDLSSLDLGQIYKSKETKEKITRYGMDFVYIPPGLFKMGSPKKESERGAGEVLHQVLLTQGFYMQTTPVTQQQWGAMMGNNPSKFKGDGERPVEKVSWDDGQDFIGRLNEREGRKVFGLPTEAQWEYACRAGTETRYYTGDTEADLDRAAWYQRNSNKTTHPVAQKEPNSFGLYDMHGNVFEWCQDWHDDYSKSGAIDPDGPSNGSHRVVRGGSWNDSAGYCRSAYRYRIRSGLRSLDLGFRLVLFPGQQG